MQKYCESMQTLVKKAPMPKTCLNKYTMALPRGLQMDLQMGVQMGLQMELRRATLMGLQTAHMMAAQMAS